MDILTVTDDATAVSPAAPAAAQPAVERKPRRRGKVEAAPELPLDPWLVGAVEAVLLSVSRPIPASRLAEALAGPMAARTRSDAVPTLPSETPASREESDESSLPTSIIDRAVKALNETYVQTGRSFRIEALAGGYRVMTVSAYAEAVQAFQQARAPHKLSRPAIETLSIIAYKQPITRAHLEAIRGVNCGEVLKSLLERQLVAVVGRAEELGRPMLYGTSPRFLTTFGLASIKDLPMAEESQNFGG